jgi:hypothetical protein
MHVEPHKNSIPFLQQYMSPFAILPSIHFYKEGLYISKQQSTKPLHGSLFTGLLATPSLSQTRNNHIKFSSHSFHSTLISTSLFNDICHMARDT